PAAHVQRLLVADPGPWSPQSVVASVKGKLMGAALITQRKSGPVLDCLFVDPHHERRRWATSMVSPAGHALLRSGEKLLVSYAHLANEDSLAWHRSIGFVEV